jgi:hypothetical protein
MADVQIRLSAIWVVLMFTYLLGDIIRIYSGDYKTGEMGGMKMTQQMYLILAVSMVVPIIMIYLSLTLNYTENRWANMILAIIYFAINLMGLPTYRTITDRFLIVVGLAFNVLTVWYAWNWI